MFYYLLFNSTFIKKADNKDKFTTTIIYGSVLYLILHGLICYFFKKTEILVYFWLALIIDICALISKSDIGSLSDVTSTFNYNPFDNRVKKVNTKELDIIDEYIEKNSYDDSNLNNDKKVRFKKKNNIQEFDNSKPPNKISKSKDVKKVKKIKPISKSTKIENVRNFEEINNNLPEYDPNDINNTLQELQDDFLNKKMEDEFSDPGSDIDLEQFENSVINS